MIKRLLFACALGALPRSAAHADDDYGATANVVRERFEEARSRTIVTHAEATKSAPANASDALETAHGVVVQRTSSGSGTPFVRGLTGYQVLLMADELRLNDSLTRAGGSATLNLIDPESIERIEVVRGPASVLYGSDALGGVVHVRTRASGVERSRESTSYGEAGMRGATAEHALRMHASTRFTGGPVGFLLSGNRGLNGRVTGGGDLGRQPYTGHEEWSVASKLEIAPARRQLLSLGHQSGHLFDMPRPDVSEPDDRQTTLTLDRDATLLRYTGRAFDGRLRLSAFAGVIVRRERRERVRPQSTQLERDHVLGHQSGLRAGVSTPHGGSVEVGAEVSIERIGSTRRDTRPTGVTRERGRYVDGSSYDMFGLYALYGQPLGQRLTLLVGGRGTLVHVAAPPDPLFADVPPNDGALDRRFFGGTGSLGLRLAFARSWHWTASLLGGFRAPNLEDFQAFGGGARGFTVPSRSLDPERSWTFESGLEFASEHFEAQLYGFGTLLTGLVVRVPTTYQGQTMVDGDPVITRRNASESVLAGGEFTITGRTDVGLYAGASTFFTWGTTRRPNDAGEQLREPATKVPPPVGVFRVGFERPGFPVFGEALLSAQLAQTRLSEGDLNDARLCADAASCKRVDGYASLTLRAGVRVEEGLQVIAALENVFDAVYKTYASGFYAPGRNFVIALRGRTP